LAQPDHRDYHQSVLFRLGRRAISSGVAFFALLGFVSVPLGEKTGWGHVQAIAQTPATSRALYELKNCVGEWQHRLTGWLTSTLRSRGGAGTKPADSARAGADDFSVPQSPKRQPQIGSIPVPRPPRLSNY
jgi:hypothetical protein